MSYQNQKNNDALELSDKQTYDKKKISLKESKSFLGIILKYMKIHKKWTIILIITSILSAAFASFNPFLLQQLQYAILHEKSQLDNSTDWWGLSWQVILGIWIAVLVLTAVFTYLSNFFGAELGKKIEISLRNEVSEKLISADMSYYYDKKTGDILTKVVSDTQIIGMQAAIIPNIILVAFFSLIFTIIALFSTTSLYIGLALIGFYVGLGILFVISFLPMRKLIFNLRKIITEINGDVTDRINTIKLIKASGTEEYEKQRFVDVHKKYYEKYKQISYYQSLMMSILFLGINTVQVVMIIIASAIYKNDLNQLRLIIGPMIMCAGMMIGPIMQFLRVIAGLLQASSSAKRIDAITSIQPTINNHSLDKQGVWIDDIKGNIIFKDVNFAYPSKPDNIVLPNFNLTLEQGKSYAFVGQTGVGKSTISKLLLRFYDVSSGEILINDKINIKDLYIPSYLAQVGYVEQEPSLLLGTILDNIKYAKPSATDQEIIQACKKAELHDLVMSWPDQYQTVIGERGFILSGGQKQRLVIARMFLKDPKILILDEATSALDNVVEKEIQKKLEELMKNRTSITIAHRLSTIKNVDQIIVLEPKKGIVQKGKFNELVNTPGQFKKLYDAGFAKYDV
ncbi:ABC transporter ATP-binding protein [Mycoplasma putrefaciens]|uniref:ABC transporter, permease and ATP-binding component n=2 Tax=Mycoplasma putrefaciens TaxID=2123 RepID=M9W9X8_9MOLU|nr:ABC transporter ATP-binding protein [Mycoplasma putrefaciens]AEM68728.1 ABC transporter, ATP-binding/permease protein [Mycoplasma putrefaciens KS1]AGJ90808.1 ABC transporter, permease and ATP-binding component [Mycoplasma putrefaciens Mput9231]